MTAVADLLVDTAAMRRRAIYLSIYLSMWTNDHRVDRSSYFHTCKQLHLLAHRRDQQRELSDRVAEHSDVDRTASRRLIADQRVAVGSNVDGRQHRSAWVVARDDDLVGHVVA